MKTAKPRPNNASNIMEEEHDQAGSNYSNDFDEEHPKVRQLQHDSASSVQELPKAHSKEVKL